MIRILIPSLLFFVLMGCGLSTGPDTQVDDSSQQVGSPTPLADAPTPLAASTEEGGKVVFESRPDVPFHGDMSIEEKIFENAVIVRAMMTSFSPEVVVEPDGKYSVVLKFNLNAREYLKGTGDSSVVAMWVDGRHYDTQAEAEARKLVVLAQRDSQWDDREAIIFLYDGSTGYGTVIVQWLKRADHFILAFADPYSADDHYSLHSKVQKIWLPAVAGASSGASSGGDSQEYLLDAPSQTGSSTGDISSASSTSSTSTITLGNLKNRIEEVTAELNRGDGSEAYKECVKRKYLTERRARYYRELDGSDLYGRSPMVNNLGSGQPAGALLHERDNHGLYPNQKAKTWLESGDASLFTVVQGDPTSVDYDKDGKLTPGEDGIYFTEMFSTVRPLPAGKYKFDLKEVWSPFFPCNYAISLGWTVTVTAPDGTTHEAFFDPQTIGSGDGYISSGNLSTGDLSPAAFTTGDTTTSITSFYGTGDAVTMTLSPYVDLTTHIFDFITGDGTTMLSLTGATGDSAAGALTWGVSKKPWSSGDQLMLRISEPPLPAPTPTPAPR